jgi:hypothetical protein
MHVTEQEQREINLPGGPAIIVVVAPEVDPEENFKNLPNPIFVLRNLPILNQLASLLRRSDSRDQSALKVS